MLSCGVTLLALGTLSFGLVRRDSEHGKSVLPIASIAGSKLSAPGDSQSKSTAPTLAQRSWVMDSSTKAQPEATQMKSPFLFALNEEKSQGRFRFLSHGSGEAATPSPTPTPTPDPTGASNNAYNWLKSRMLSTGLVDSYQNQDDICYTYDQAVAAIAFLAKGDNTNARKVLDAMKSLQGSDGSWHTAYFGNSLAV